MAKRKNHCLEEEAGAHNCARQDQKVCQEHEGPKDNQDRKEDGPQKSESQPTDRDTSKENLDAKKQLVELRHKRRSSRCRITH